MMRKQKWVVALMYATTIVADESKQHVSQSWYAKLMTRWELLGTHIQLAIQLALVLFAFYALTCWFRCKKQCGCGQAGCNCSTGCNCGCASGEKCTCVSDKKSK